MRILIWCMRMGALLLLFTGGAQAQALTQEQRRNEIIDAFAEMITLASEESKLPIRMTEKPKPGSPLSIFAHPWRAKDLVGGIRLMADIDPFDARRTALTRAEGRCANGRFSHEFDATPIGPYRLVRMTMVCRRPEALTTRSMWLAINGTDTIEVANISVDEVQAQRVDAAFLDFFRAVLK